MGFLPLPWVRSSRERWTAIFLSVPAAPLGTLIQGVVEQHPFIPSDMYGVTAAPLGTLIQGVGDRHFYPVRFAWYDLTRLLSASPLGTLVQLRWTAALLSS